MGAVVVCSGFGIVFVILLIYAIFDTATRGSITSIIILVVSFLLILLVVAFLIYKRRAKEHAQKLEAVRKQQ